VRPLPTLLVARDQSGAEQRPRSEAYVVEPIGPEAQGDWDRLRLRHPASRAIVPRWEELAGWTSVRFGAFEGGHLAGGLVLSVRRIPKTPVSLSRITLALLAAGREAEMLALLLAAVDRYAARHLVLETELRLRIPAGGQLSGFADTRVLDGLLRELGYRPLAKVSSTYFVPIDRDDDALLGSFASKARNKIRKAEKDGARVVVSRDPRLLEDFHQAHLDMKARKSAPIPPRILIAEGLIPLLEREEALLVTESYGDRIANMAIVDALGVPCYTLGARTRAHAAGELAGAAQIVHYELMKRFRDRGGRYYDLGGCEGPVPIEGHSNYGVWRFKHAFNGIFVKFMSDYRKTRALRRYLDPVHRYRGDYV
jgi:hypothetical protein